MNTGTEGRHQSQYDGLLQTGFPEFHKNMNICGGWPLSKAVLTIQ